MREILFLPFGAFISAFIAGDETIPKKEKERLYKRFGAPPPELQIGQLMDKFSQTPWQLGFADTPDLALLYRCMHATQAYRIAQHLPNNVDSMTIDEGLIVGRIKDIIDHKKRMSKKRLNHTAVFDF